MFGLEIATVGLLHLTTISTKASELDCQPKKELIIEVIPNSTPALHDYTKTTAEINMIGQGAYSAYGADHNRTELRGLTVGRQSLKHNIEFYFEKHEDVDLVCLQIRNVKITMDYKPTVYVSTKFTQGTPIFQKILEHEIEHVKITQKLLREYSEILEQRLKNTLKRGYSAGPFKVEEMNMNKQALGDRALNVISAVNEAMRKESHARHNMFDDDELRDVQQYNRGVARKLEKILKIDER